MLIIEKKMNTTNKMHTFNCGYGLVLIFKKEFSMDEFIDIGYII